MLSVDTMNNRRGNMLSEREREQITAMLSSLPNTLYYTSVGGNHKGNHIIRFDLVEKETAEKSPFGWLVPAGVYVRPVWSDDPERNDGYYDINVSGCSVNGVFASVAKWLTNSYI